MVLVWKKDMSMWAYLGVLQDFKNVVQKNTESFGKQALKAVSRGQQNRVEDFIKR